MMFKQEGMDKIYSKSVAIFGVGGVGGVVVIAGGGLAFILLRKKKLINYDKQLLQIFNKYVNNKIIQ